MRTEPTLRLLPLALAALAACGTVQTVPTPAPKAGPAPTPAQPAAAAPAAATPQPVAAAPAPAQPAAPAPAPAPVAPAPRQEIPRPRIALALGGGAARGFAHVGVIRVLEQEKIPLDLIVGTSVGSLIGAIYASDGNSFELEWTAFKLEKDDLFDYGLMSAVMGMGPVKGDKLEKFVKSRIQTPVIEQLKVPYAAVATDLNRGTRVVIDHGPIFKAVRASCSIPGIFEPLPYEGKLLVDGGVLENIPIATARQKGADIVIAVDISENVQNFKISNMLDVMLQSVNIMFDENVKAKKKDADVLITPAVGDVSTLDFTQKKRCMQAGIEAAQKALPSIRKAIEDWTARKMGSHPVASAGGTGDQLN